MLLDWAAERDLRLLNVGDAPTCTRPQGTSVVDLTWACLHGGSAISEWTVLGVETMSDYQYISFDYTGGRGENLSEAGRYPRWNTDNLDEELLKAILDLECMDPWGGDLSVDQLAGRMYNVMVDGYNLAARRVGRRPPKRAAYWWNPGISILHAMCTRTRRRLTRLRRRGPSQQRDAAEVEYRAAKRALKAAIKETQGKAWRELIKTVDKDLWGLPYKLVLSRLRRTSPRLTEQLEVHALEPLMDSLFPEGEAHNPEEIWGEWQGPLEDFAISTGETVAAIRRSRRKGGNSAPGPDGLTSRMWSMITKAAVSRLTEVFNACLEKGKYPARWKRAILVLIPKGGALNREAQLVKARPICLLDEAGKLMERIWSCLKGSSRTWKRTAEHTCRTDSTVLERANLPLML